MIERALPNVDFRVIQQIQSSPNLLQEQGVGWLSSVGGPSGFIALDKAGIGDVYNAIQGGATTEELPILTGLSNSDISSYLVVLREKGLIEPLGVVSL